MRANYTDPWQVRPSADGKGWVAYYHPTDYDYPQTWPTERSARAFAAGLNEQVDQQQVDIDRAYG